MGRVCQAVLFGTSRLRRSSYNFAGVIAWVLRSEFEFLSLTDEFGDSRGHLP
jgi:hypothetical protein